MTQKITIIGIGDDGVDGLSATARAALDDATLIAGAGRHLAMLGGSDARETRPWSKDLDRDVDHLADQRHIHRIAVLASGDPMLHGIGVRLIARFGVDAVTVIPAPSAFSLAAARMGWPLGDPSVTCISVHAQPFDALRRLIQPGVRLLILSRDGGTPSRITHALTEAGFGASTICVLEHMGGTTEKRTEAIARDGLPGPFKNLNTVAVTCIAGAEARLLSLAPGLPDDAFEHDGTITKRDVRAVTLAHLAPRPGEMLWDIGAGNGTIAIEWLRAEPRARAVAFEHDPERIARIHVNATRLGVPDLIIVEGMFPSGIPVECAAPDVVFVGGGVATDGVLIDVCLGYLRPGGRLVANAVTLKAQTRLIAAHAEFGGELVRIGIARAEPLGPHQALKPAIDVLQWRATKP